MFFSLPNALATFKSIANYILRPFINRFIFMYLNNVLIYLKTLGEYKQYI